MATYLANQIILGKLDYMEVVVKRPSYKAEIDAYLTSKNKSELILIGN